MENRPGKSAEIHRVRGTPVALENLETMVMPSELSTTDQTSPTDAGVQETCCVNTSNSSQIQGQHFTTLDDEELDRLKGLCREYTLPGSDQSSHVKGWIRGNTMIGAVLDVIVCYHRGRYGVEIMIGSLFGDNLLLGPDREWNQHVRDGDVGRDSL